MNILSAEGISKSYSEKILFNDISLGISDGEKIGLIGINGVGKSTLLKVIAGVETSDTGRIIKGNSVRIGYLPQNPVLKNGMTVLSQVFEGDTPVMKLLSEYEYALHKFNENPDAQLEKHLLSLTQNMDSLGAWDIESEAKTILTKLGINDFEADAGTLSGGQRKRVALARVLINPVDLIILDEPTNHLDNDTVDWLENFLNNRKGALLMITHDRYFLDRVANRVIELDSGKLYSYEANYSKFLELKAEREELLQASERKRQSLLRKELEWIRRGAKARSTKQKARIERFEKLQDQQGIVSSDSVEIMVGSSRLGRKIIEMENICKGYSGINLINCFSYILRRDDRIGIIGPNGMGKTTLVKIIANRLEPDSGNIDYGETVKIGFFSQENEEMDHSLRVIDYIRQTAEYVTTKEGKISASQMLETFLFPPSVQWTPISKLSGGEKRRLYLLNILMSEPNILILDEPTNDLDIQTLTILESYLDEFPGAVITVSHDRYFLDRIVNSIFAFEGNGLVKQYSGNYSDYQSCRKEFEAQTKSSSHDTEKSKEKNSNETTKDKPLKLTFKEQKEFEEIDEKIASLEEALKNITVKIDEASSNFELLPSLLSEKEALEKQLEEKIERWAYLNELVERINNNKKM
ncbi:ABC-F family ATP-binding cassette domain-containing protein [Pseudobacteroides cellulosolvens]|uniref:ABC transporter related protein n=1 Tax=Pseudobacteroides cellulosolvens ATCC 35603 = DSM 2933 TaxID=398512 RepID=A0A0L6JP28_9FIRM|nr:ABC-F family ATP-binding cassette domain-containing protein [Pseudobacteroides cellulosolvens]KNY27539.1 ABC transporter related protein [Pseudobacteroides cellulosolvens ATCC 35603 = DSM 2933]